MMTCFPLQTCCEWLRVDPKTLRTWLQHAQMPLYLHPTDARMKCLTMGQVQQLAALHGRALQPHLPARPELAQPVASQEALGLSEREGERASTQGHDEAAWLKQIADLQAQMAQLSQHLAHLRSLAGPATLSSQQDQAVQGQDGSADRKITGAESTLAAHPSRVWTPNPGESRRSRVVPLIEYGAAGRYVLICPQEGELLIDPDSPEWFSWLASLSSFRFVGQAGRFSACRAYDRGPKRTWYAYRTIHQHDYKHYLGTTDRLTVAHLEQMAATLQSYVSSL